LSTDPIHELLLRHRLVAVLRLDDLSHAEPLVEALLEAGVRVMEFTLTNPEALPVIRRLSKRIETFSDGSAALGVGSVMSVGQARASLTAGAQFVVTPVVERDVIRYCDGNGVPIFPGALTPTEIHTARLAGARIVKLFPAGRMGPDYVRDLLAPFPEFELMPTGGVGLDNLGRFLGNGAVAVGVGNNLIDASALAAGDWAAVSRHATKFVEAAEAA
jgi:2-dehydro-3-deoxyphosphogluconate aldolase/(4S)-4-hydroxy-2-oxoglutarate aldolase